MEKKLLLAVSLSLIVMLTYPLILKKISPSYVSQEVRTQPIETKEVIKEPVDYKPALNQTKQIQPQESYGIFNAHYLVNINTIGGSIGDIQIKNHRNYNIALVEGALYDAGLLSIEGKGTLSGLSSQPFVIKKDINALYAEYNGLAITKNFKFLPDRYALEARISIKNNTNNPIALDFDITTGTNISDKEALESRYIISQFLSKDGKIQKVSDNNLKQDKRLYQQDIEWLALQNKYYSIIVKPDFSPSGVFAKKINNKLVTGFIVENEKINSGELREYKFIVYLGPTELIELEKVDKGFAKALNFGVFTGISLLLLSILQFFYHISHSYGIAILLLTCCVSLLLFPLSFKSLKSMRKLQELQPKIEKLRQDYKDSPQKLNKEIMEIYRRYKVNPFGGCMPMVLQMPIFIALYQTLMKSVELKGAPFLWMKDLSMPDAAFKLPFVLPLVGNTLNILPILMIGAMILQQKLSQVNIATPQTDQQKMMSSIMPIMMGFIFYSLPAGLVLYWLTNTILSSALQYITLRKV